ncbi:hypothetical protein [Haloactinomyces albus]|uniref:Uncharacterized protein n=1 Tax=Haloactinomyces albus TaxID=1352928 RepID=A0AAE3ZA06_9ACTN|nr:hypothetical protein [Haloactinomyces albus]MDR7300050.1 hypothetical protein [Haloactinomyces albus]
MDRKSALVLSALAVVVVGFLVVRDPIGAADTVHRGWDLLVGTLTMITEALTTFFRHLFAG